ncbi:MAG: YraN family protein [Clostridiales bacterium]|nr:YraN family protein [Clostridiales bacterium]
MYQKHEIGKIGEDIAVKYLLEKGYQILERNFECKQGEIDIVAKDKEEYVFVEVKTRSNENYGKPKDAVDETKKKHIYRSVEFYVYINQLENKPIRIDVIQIYKKKEKYLLNHIKQAISERPYI